MTELFEPIAVIGVAGRYPGAADVDDFWRNLRAGRDCISPVTDDELIAAGIAPSRIADSAYVKMVGRLPGVDEFDAEYFGMSSGDADMCDPQLRLLLATTHEAIEDAGYSVAGIGRDVAVFAAAGSSRYATVNLLPHPRYSAGMTLGMSALNTLDSLATLVSYKFDFRGPSMCVLTACSSSLTAIHLACQSLQLGECDVAVAGACNVELPYGSGYTWIPGDVRSPDGHCRPFDAMATGTIFTSGVGAVVLKRLADAVSDGDDIRGVVRGVGVNNDGSDKVSFSAPSVSGQARAVADAMSLAGVRPRDISFVEMHATGTAHGDPVEVAALATAYRHLADGPVQPGAIPVGSVKANIGHCVAAAGMAGLHKLLLAFAHEELPPTANLTVVNPRLEIENTPFTVLGEALPWPRTPGRRRLAGLSSFGIGGTNTHLIIEEGPVRERTPACGRPRVVIWSARDDAAQLESRRRLANHFGRVGDALFADSVATLQQGRREHPVRGAVVCRGANEAAARLAEEGRDVVRGTAADPAPRLAFVFGPDAYPGMGVGLYGSQRVFTETVDECLELFARHGLDLYPDWLAHAPSPTPAALRFAVGYALARQLADWGLEPAALVGDGPDDPLPAAVAGTVTPAEAARAIAMGRPLNAARAHQVPVFNAPEGVPADLLIELGPAALGDRRLAALPDAGKRGEQDEVALLTLASVLWASGAAVRWERMYLDEPLQRIPVPGYPLRRERHWVDPVTPTPPNGQSRAAVVAGTASPFLLPSWAETDELAAPGTGLPDGSVCLALLPADPAAAALPLAALRATGLDVVAVTAGPDVGSVGGAFTVRPQCLSDDLDRVLAELADAGRSPSLVVHAWAVADDFPDVDDGVLFTLVDLIGRASRQPVAGRLLAILVITTGAVDVSGGEQRRPAPAALVAMLRSYALESPIQWCRLIDCGPGVTAGALADELRRGWAEPVAALRGTRRWLPADRPVGLPSGTGDLLREQGVYLLTGGLGGVGSAVARGLAATGLRPRLALLGRSVDGGERLRDELVAAGAQVRLIAADVADEVSLDAALDEVGEDLGPVRGVFHLAGVAGEAMLQRLDRSAMRAVLRPKVAGTLALRRCLARRPPTDFVVCFSSRAALSGMVGGADYAAANAFMDAVATGTPGWHSVNWPAWGGPGMAAGGRLDVLAERVRDVAPAPGSVVDERVVSAASTWALDEHRIGGVPVLPGTALVDLLVGAARRLVPGEGGAVALRDLVFRRPLLGAEPRQIRVVFGAPDADGRAARVLSRSADGAGPWVEHASCIAAEASTPGRRVDLQAWRAGLAETPTPVARPSAAFAFGPRWQNVRRMWRHGDRALVEVGLAEPYAAETAEHSLHPALLDTATGILGGGDGESFYAPFTYDSMVWHRPLPAVLLSHLTERSRSATTVTTDIELADLDGSLLATITGLRRRRIGAAEFVTGDSVGRGIQPRDGVRLLLSLLCVRGTPAQVAVRASGDAPQPSVPAARAAQAQPVPEVPEAPSMPIEDRLREVWCAVVGRTDVTLDSDFFDLGGDSLSALALTGRIRDEFGVELGVESIFDAPTMAELTELIVANITAKEG